MGPDGRTRVYVFTHPGKRKPRYLAYTMWVNPSWPGACLHLMSEVNGTVAKKLAIAEHKETCVSQRPAKLADAGG